MGHFQETIHIAAPIGHVWELNADARRIPEWDANTIEVRDFPERIDHVGAKFISVWRVMGRQLTGTSETTKVEKPHRLEQAITMPGGGRASIAIDFEEADGGTNETLVADYELPFGFLSGVAEKVLSGAIQRDFRHSNENFKALCEATIPQPA